MFGRRIIKFQNNWKKRKKKYISFNEKEGNPCYWTTSIEIEESFKYKFAISKGDSIKRWQAGNYKEIKIDELNEFAFGKSNTGKFGGCTSIKEEDNISLDCSW